MCGLCQFGLDIAIWVTPTPGPPPLKTCLTLSVWPGHGFLGYTPPPPPPLDHHYILFLDFVILGLASGIRWTNAYRRELRLKRPMINLKVWFSLFLENNGPRKNVCWTNVTRWTIEDVINSPSIYMLCYSERERCVTSRQWSACHSSVHRPPHTTKMLNLLEPQLVSWMSRRSRVFKMVVRFCRRTKEEEEKAKTRWWWRDKRSRRKSRTTKEEKAGR